MSPTQKVVQSDKPIWYFLLCWTIFNLAQAYRLELQADEAYYWLYSRFLDWGYFDHPPMVALFIRIGDTLMHNELGLRLLTVLTSTASIYLLWLILKKYAVDAWAFILVISGIFIFHIYGFTTTPDAPLFFFAVLFYFFYQKYIDHDKWTLALALGIVVACLLYSKYHAALLILFTVACNIKLLKRPSFWLIVFLAAILYIPHILWQVQHGYPSVNYHLYDRSAATYDSANSFLYLPGQLLMAGPLIGWFLFYKAFTVKIKDAFIRCLLVNCIGTLVFFFISTFRGEAQPHWTLIAFAPLAMLVLIGFKQPGGRPAWFYPVAIINMLVIVLFRLGVLFAVPVVTQIGQIKSYYGYKDWAHIVKQKAGDAYVIMDDNFQNPAKYDYYNNTLKGFSYDTRNYRRTQFDIWPIEEQMQHQRALHLTDDPTKNTTDSIKIKVGKWYVEWIDDVRTYQKVKVEIPYHELKLHTGDKKDIDLTITNPYPYQINFSNNKTLHEVAMDACFYRDDGSAYTQRAPGSFNNLVLNAGESKHFIFNINSPSQKGKYELMFSISTAPFGGSKNSNFIAVEVE